MKRIFLALLPAFAAVSICTLSVSAQQIAAKKDGNAPGFHGVAASKPAAAATDPSYVIGPEDVLSINVWHEPELSSNNLPVRPDGKISLPLVNDVQAAGLTPNQLRSVLLKKLAEYVPSPEVSVIVREVHSFKVSVIGEVKKTGRHELKGRATVLDILAMAEGFGEFAGRGRIVVLRPEGKTMRQIPFNYNKVMSSNGALENFFLQPGDIIVVP